MAELQAHQHDNRSICARDLYSWANSEGTLPFVATLIKAVTHSLWYDSMAGCKKVEGADAMRLAAEITSSHNRNLVSLYSHDLAKFNMMDTDRDGIIDTSEFYEYLRDTHFWTTQSEMHFWDVLGYLDRYYEAHAANTYTIDEMNLLI